MAIFVKLTSVDSGQPVWVNMDLVEAVERRDREESTALLYPDYAPDQCTQARYVVEHPDYIMNIMAMLSEE
jgi:hypothetical protein